jgi:hypothetical protein
MGDYYLDVLDATGANKLVAGMKNFITADYARAENTIGAATFSVPLSYWNTFFTGNDVKVDTRVLVYRNLPGGTPYLDMETEWLVQDGEEVQDAEGKTFINLYAVDGPWILDTRNVAYYAKTSYTEKTSTVAGNMMKAIIRENMGSLATDTARDLSTWLAVQADLGDGATLSKAFDRRQVLPTIQEICDASTKAGSYITSDVVSKTPGKLEFRTYANQRGNDHRATSTSPLLVGRDAKNITDFHMRFSHAGEVTYAYTGGSGDAATRPIGTGYDAVRMAVSPFRRIERFIDGLNTVYVSELNAEADAQVRANRPRVTVDGTIVQTPSFLYGLHFKWGDYLTLADRNRSFDIRLPAVRVQVTGGKETITAKFRGES